MSVFVKYADRLSITRLSNTNMPTFGSARSDHRQVPVLRGSTGKS